MVDSAGPETSARVFGDLVSSMVCLSHNEMLDPVLTAAFIFKTILFDFNR